MICLIGPQSPGEAVMLKNGTAIVICFIDLLNMSAGSKGGTEEASGRSRGELRRDAYLNIDTTCSLSRLTGLVPCQKSPTRRSSWSPSVFLNGGH